MGKYGKVIFLAMLTALTLRSHRGREVRYQPMALVTQVEVSCRDGDRQLRRVYTQPEKMCQVLNYLRLQKNLGAPHTNPERIMGPAYRICIRTLDGRQHIYQQRADRYLSREYAPWQIIEPTGQLRRILQQTPSDTILGTHHDALAGQFTIYPPDDS